MSVLERFVPARLPRPRIPTIGGRNVGKGIRSRLYADSVVDMIHDARYGMGFVIADVSESLPNNPHHYSALCFFVGAFGGGLYVINDPVFPEFSRIQEPTIQGKAKAGSFGVRRLEYDSITAGPDFIRVGEGDNVRLYQHFASIVGEFSGSDGIYSAFLGFSDSGELIVGGKSSVMGGL